MNRKILQTIRIVLPLIIGIIAGLMIGNVPYITFKSEVGFGDVANFILAFFIAIFIPIGLNSWLDNRKNIKSFLIDEVKTCIGKIEKIKDKIDGCAIQKKTGKEDLREIMQLLGFLDMKICSLCEQLKISFEKESCDVRNTLVEKCLTYWKKTTEDGIPGENFKINKEFCNKHDKAFLAFELYLKEIIHLINQF